MHWLLRRRPCWLMCSPHVWVTLFQRQPEWQAVPSGWLPTSGVQVCFLSMRPPLLSSPPGAQPGQGLNCHPMEGQLCQSLPFPAELVPKSYDLEERWEWSRQIAGTSDAKALFPWFQNFLPSPTICSFSMLCLSFGLPPHPTPAP